MKLLEVYRNCSLTFIRIMFLILLELIFLIVLVTTIPLWWLKCIKKLLTNFADLIEEVIYDLIQCNFLSINGQNAVLNRMYLNCSDNVHNRRLGL